MWCPDNFLNLLYHKGKSKGYPEFFTNAASHYFTNFFNNKLLILWSKKLHFDFKPELSLYLLDSFSAFTSFFYFHFFVIHRKNQVLDALLGCNPQTGLVWFLCLMTYQPSLVI